MNTCGECEFFEKVNEHGKCKKKSACLSLTIAGTHGQWPDVKESEKACGEFAAAN